MMPAFSAKKANIGGVTLIELLAVILIAGLLAAIGVPAFNSILKGTALRTAAKALTDTFSLARQFAITNRYLYHVELDDELTVADRGDEIKDDSLQEQRYRIYFVDRDAKDRDNPRESEKITVRKWRLLPKFVKFDLTNKPPAEIIFKPTGGALTRRDDGKYIFQWECKFKILQAESGTSGTEKTMTISVNGITGRAKAEKG